MRKTGRFFEEKKAGKRTGRYSCLNMDSIFEFTEQVDLIKVRRLIAEQIECNTNIAQAGLSSSYEREIGKTLLSVYGMT